MENELTTEEMLLVLRAIYSLSPRRIVFTGGEPLLRQDILELVQALRNMGDGAILCLTTNGTLINEENAKSLVENFDEIRISIDGSEEMNDAMRGKGTYKKVMKAFRCILRAGGGPVAFITVTSLNLPHLKDFMRFAFGKGIFKIHLSPLKLAGRANDDMMLCDFEEMERVLGEFWQETFGLQLKSQRKHDFNCGVGRFITVYPDGSVYPCHLLAFPEFCVGNVRNHTLNSIYCQSSLINILRNLRFSDIAECTKCFKKFSQERTCLGVLAEEWNSKQQLLDLLISGS